ncbi:MAG: hypothetical protein ACOCZ5_02295, partial [bacterium]
MIGVNGLNLLHYFRTPESAFGKSIQRNWQFYGFFLFSPFKAVGRQKEFPPVIQPFHLLDVTIPVYEFEKKIMWYGQVPRTFPVLNFQGFNVDVTLEEDEQGTVEYFINWNQRNIIDRDGYYNPPNKVKFRAFTVEVQDKMGIPVVYYIFHDLYFLSANAASYTYTGNESIKRTITFA